MSHDVVTTLAEGERRIALIQVADGGPPPGSDLSLTPEIRAWLTSPTVHGEADLADRLCVPLVSFTDRLAREVLAIAIGPDYLALAVHPDGALTTPESSPMWPCVRDTVLSRWKAKAMKSPEDLAILVIEEASRRMMLARRAISTAIDNWEVEYFRANGTITREARDRLFAFRSAVAELRRDAAALHRAGASEHKGSLWFLGTDVDVEARADSSIERTLQSTEALAERLRSLADMAHARHSEHLQHILGAAAGAALVPALVASIYGANVDVPGKNSWMGLVVLLILMVAGGVVGGCAAIALMQRSALRTTGSQTGR